MNIVVLQGTLSRPPEIRSTSSGDVITYEVTTRPDEGPAATAPVAWSQPPKGAYSFSEGDSVTVVGQVRRRFFRSGGSTQSRTEVIADLVASTRQRKRIATEIDRVLTEIESAAPV